MNWDTHKQNRRAEFVTDEGGNTIMIFGLSLIPVLLMLGATADYTRYTMTRAALQQATDGAALMVASKMSPTTTNAQAKSQAQVMLASNSRMNSAVVDSAEISADKQTLCVNSHVSVPNAFMQMASFLTLTPSVKACASLAGGTDPNATYEIALVLDNSGSMASSAGGVSKMQALRTAATSFVNTMYSKSTNVKMSVVPFAANVVVVDPAVNSNRSLSWIDTAGNNSQHWITFGGKSAANTAGFTNRFDVFDKLKQSKSSWDWGGCFEELTYPKNVQDTAQVTGDAETQFVPFLAPDEPSSNSNYENSYRPDNYGSGVCSSSVSGDWNKLTRACKYNNTASSTSSNTPNDHCPSASTQTMLQLTPTKTTITSKISQLDDGGNTNLHAGFMWGWRSISPTGPFAAGAPYASSSNRKVMVFMTDGYNNWKAETNTVTGSSYQALGYYSYNNVGNERLPDGSLGNGVNYREQLRAAANKSSSYWSTSRDTLDEMTRQACTNAKAAGIEVFTIGFSTPDDPIDAQGLALMKNCATNDDHYFKAENADQLNAAFASIGIGIGKLRLSQ